jgi:hypothetical protein
MVLRQLLGGTISDLLPLVTLAPAPGHQAEPFPCDDDVRVN